MKSKKRFIPLVCQCHQIDLNSIASEIYSDRPESFDSYLKQTKAGSSCGSCQNSHKGPRRTLTLAYIWDRVWAQISRKRMLNEQERQLSMERLFPCLEVSEIFDELEKAKKLLILGNLFDNYLNTWLECEGRSITIQDLEGSSLFLKLESTEGTRELLFQESLHGFIRNWLRLNWKSCQVEVFISYS